MRASSRLLHQCGGRVFIHDVDDEAGTQPLRVIQLAVVDVDADNIPPHRLGVLDGHMPEATAAGDRDPLAGLRLANLIPL